MTKAFFLGCWVVGLGVIARAPRPVFSPTRTQPGSFYCCKVSDIRYSRIPNARQPNSRTSRRFNRSRPGSIPPSLPHNYRTTGTLFPSKGPQARACFIHFLILPDLNETPRHFITQQPDNSLGKISSTSAAYVKS